MVVSPPGAALVRPLERRIVDLLPSLRRYARSLAGNASDADDLVQDSLETALENLGGWRGGSLRAWLTAIMTNLHRNARRRRGTLSRIVADEALRTPAASHDAFATMRLAAALERLSPDHRAVLMLVVIEGYRYEEVAEMLGVPLGTVMSRLSRARKSLSRELSESNVVGLRSLR